MDPLARPPRSDDTKLNSADPASAVIDSNALMAGRREVLIRHGANTYRLRVTASNKLILTK
jgi:hemin uptake protein HemP